MKTLAVISTHPIQYYAPVFKLLSENVNVKVFYTWGKDSIEAKFDPGFGRVVSWDLPLLDGYTYEFLENTSSAPGSHHFKGIINPDIINKIAEFKPDAILIYGWSYSSHLKALRHFKGKVPVWFRGDSNLIDQKNGLKTVLRKLFLRWVYSKIDKALYVGSANKEYFKKYGLREKQLIFAPHAIDNKRFEADRLGEVQALRESLQIAKESIVILFAGKLEPKKNPELLLEAFMRLETENLHLVFAGNGVLEETLKLKAEQWLKENKRMNISFLDFQNQQQMPVVYQLCDIFCLPSKGPGETWGLAVNEAMASGKAIIASNKVGCAQDLVTEKNGFIFESGSVEDLASKLTALCKSKEALTLMGDFSKLHIKSWSFMDQVNAIERALAER